jgi:hypothetical protein
VLLLAVRVQESVVRVTARASIGYVEAAVLAAGGTFHQRGANVYRSRGICHGGTRSEALVFMYGAERGRVNVHCHAGCEFEHILDILGLTKTDLYDEPLRRDDFDVRVPKPRKHAPPKPEPVVFDPAPAGWRPPEDGWMPRSCGHCKSDEYLYTDEQDRVLYAAARCPEKCIRFWRPDPDARAFRHWSLDEQDKRGNVIARTRRVPFRLPQLIKAVADERIVWICEGEKDVLAVAARPGCAATNSKGWRPEFAQFFTGADVCIAADRDRAGRTIAENLVKALMPVARSIEVVQAAWGNDCSDHFAAGGHTGNFVRVAEPKPYPVEAP